MSTNLYFVGLKSEHQAGGFGQNYRLGSETYLTRFAADCALSDHIAHLNERIVGVRKNAWMYAYPEVEVRRLENDRDRWEVREMTWRQRELFQFDEGHYEQLPWVHETFWVNNPSIHADHFAHISVEDPSMIAFTMSEAHGEQNRQTRMRPGKYLMRYFSEHLTTKQVAFYAEWFARKERPHEEIGDPDVHFSSSQHEVVEVYENGPCSCMTETEAVRVYHGGDIQLAWLTGDNPGRPHKKVIARCIVWPENKVFGRVYPTPDRYYDDGWPSLEAAQAVQMDLFHRLRKMGYMHVSEGGSFEGARLPVLRHDGGVLCPYLDSDYEIQWDSQSEFMVMTENGNYSADSTEGWLDGWEGNDNTWTCERCEDGQPDHDDRYSIYDGWTASSGPFGRETWCYDCAVDNGRSFYCEATGVRYDERSSSSVQVYDCSTSYTETWNDDYAEEHAWTCSLTDDFFSIAHQPPVTLHDGRKVSREAFEEADGFTCSYDGLNYLGDEESEKWPGFPASMDDLRLWTATRERHAR